MDCLLISKLPTHDFNKPDHFVVVRFLDNRAAFRSIIWLVEFKLKIIINQRTKYSVSHAILGRDGYEL